MNANAALHDIYRSLPSPSLCFGPNDSNMVSSTFEELYMLGNIIWVSVISILTLSYATVSSRLWVRYRITKSVGMDDAAMVITLVSFGESGIRSKESTDDCKC
jgi:hypothetical protein